MLLVVSTPIGNLGDISIRAIDALKKADIILAEDTRVSKKLLDSLGIKNKKMMAFYDEVEERVTSKVISLLKQGTEVALISDAGTPLLSDPGFKLIQKCWQENIKYSAIPGPSAVINALILSGLRVDKFCFVGFVPKKAGKRKQKLADLKSFDGSKILFESAKRLNDLLNDIEEVFGNKTQVAICWEMTKMHEEVIKGQIDQVKSMVANGDQRGEVTVVFI